MEALLDGQQRCGLKGAHIASTADSHGPRRGSPVVGEVDDTHKVGTCNDFAAFFLACSPRRSYLAVVVPSSIENSG
jgi:hypothetical protein